MDARTIDITAAQQRIILAEIRRHLPDITVWAYGSRAKWTSRPQSDLDLVAFTQPEQDAQVESLREALEESDLPFRVDLFVWDKVPQAFRREIKAEYVVLLDGPMPCSPCLKWPISRIEDISEKVAIGPFGSSIKVSTFVPDGIPIISGQHLHDIKVNDSPGFNFISHKHAQKLKNANVERGDVIFTHAGNIGQVAYIPENSKFDRYVISQRQFYMRCDRSKAIPEFIALYFTSREGQHQLLANASQVGVPSIAQPVTYLRTIQIPLPPLPEQRAIAHILGTLDDKIELNRRMNETLEAMARAIFNDWFVNFGPVRAKMEGRETGLPEEIAALFPDRMMDSELGEIPEGWELCTLQDTASYVLGGDWGKSEPTEETPLCCLCIRGADIANLQNFMNSQMPMRYLKANSFQKRQLRPWDIVFEISGGSPTQSTGRAVLITPELLKQKNLPLTTSNFCRLIRFDTPTLAQYLYYSFRIAYDKDEFFQYELGTTGIKNFGYRYFSESRKFVFPDSVVLGLYSEIITSFLSKCGIGMQANMVLCALRDSLLPKLISGDLRTKDAEHIVKAI